MPGPAYHARTHLPGGTDPLQLALDLALDAKILADSGLVAFWKLNESAGTTAEDSGPGNLDLTVPSLHPSPTWGQAALTPGEQSAGFSTPTTSAQRLTRGGTIPDLSLGDFSAEIWIKRDGATASAAANCIMGQGDGAMTGGAGWALFVAAFNQGNELVLIKDGSNTLAGVTVVTASGDDHHVAVTFKNATNTWIIYLDGAQEATEVDAITGNDGFWIGAQDNTTTTVILNGLASYAAIYDRVLTPAEIADHYATGSPGSGAAQWKVYTSEGDGTAGWEYPTIEVEF